MARIIKKSELYARLQDLAKDFEVIGPREFPRKGIFYEKLADLKELYLGEGFTTGPAKEFFFLPSEYLSAARFKEGGESIEEIPSSENKRIIIGLRPCEARGLVLLDKVFDAEYKDKFYINNRLRSVIVGLSCSAPDKDCFCASMGGSPVESRGMDALIFSAGGQFIAEIITDKAKDIFGSIGRELNQGEQKAWEADKAKSKAALSRKINPPESLGPVFQSPYWGKAASACLSCGICTYLCPSCHCFDLVDEERKKLRCYDGCAFSDFTLEASGVNPRPQKNKRYRQRAFHKFDYFKKNYGENLCVGCGRCIRYCPVKIDIAEIIAKVPVS